MHKGGLPELDRRALLKSAILLVGGSLAGLPATALAQAAETPQRFFTPAEYAILDAVAETIIPKTDTPGAREAGVPAAFDALMTNWASDESRQQFRDLLADIDTKSAGVAALADGPRTEAVRAYDAAAFAANEPVYRRFKELVLTLYYLSEAGATQELRYELVPGTWDASIPVTPDTRAWAA